HQGTHRALVALAPRGLGPPVARPGRPESEPPALPGRAAPGRRATRLSLRRFLQPPERSHVGDDTGPPDRQRHAPDRLRLLAVRPGPRTRARPEAVALARRDRPSGQGHDLGRNEANGRANVPLTFPGPRRRVANAAGTAGKARESTGADGT